MQYPCVERTANKDPRSELGLFALFRVIPMVVLTRRFVHRLAPTPAVDSPPSVMDSPPARAENEPKNVEWTLSDLVFSSRDVLPRADHYKNGCGGYRRPSIGDLLHGNNAFYGGIQNPAFEVRFAHYLHLRSNNEHCHAQSYFIEI